MTSSFNCPICQTAATCNHDPQTGTDYWFCPECEFVQKDKNHWPDEETEKNRYLLHDQSPDDSGYIQMFEDFIRATITPFASRVQRILDFGCGHQAVLAEILKKHGFSVDVVDPFFYPDTDLQTRTFDCVTATEVIEHLRDPLDTFRFIDTLLNPGGLLAIRTNFLPGSEKNFFDWWYIRDITHLSFYSVETFNRIAGILGWRLIKHNDSNTAIMEKSS